MTVIKNNRSKSIVVLGIMIYLSFFSSCSPIVMENNPEQLLLVKNIFYEAGYYYHDIETDIYTTYDINKRQIGYVFLAEGRSYSGSGLFSKSSAPMKILIGLVDKNTIKNIYVVTHGEDNEFWGMLDDKGYFDQFVQLNIKDAALKRDGGQIDAVTGATLSSMSVVDIVREATLEKVKLIK